MRRPRRVGASLVAVVLVAVSLVTVRPAAAAETRSPVFITTSGTVPYDETVTVDIDVTADSYTAGSSGWVLLGLTAGAAIGSFFDGGSIVVRPAPSADPGFPVPDQHNTPGSGASYTVAVAEPGISYQAIIRAEEYTSGRYDVSVVLAGDVDADFRVDDNDLTLIDQLAGVAYGDERYSAWADVDRSGVVDGQDRLLAAANLGAATAIRLPLVDPVDDFLPPGVLTLAGINPAGFNDGSTAPEFRLSGGEFSTEPANTVLRIDGYPVPEDQLIIEPGGISMRSLQRGAGRHQIELSALDTVGRIMHFSTFFWVGTETVPISIVDTAGSPVTEPVTVRVTLDSDVAVDVQEVTTTGQVALAHVPGFQTFRVTASTADNRTGSSGGSVARPVRVTLLGFGEPSAVANNDFSSGVAGWNTGTSPVAVGAHVEGLPSAGLAGLAAQPGKAQRRVKPAAGPAKVGGPQASGASQPAAAASIDDNDLTLSTSGPGEQSISRTFTTGQDVTAIRLRYRFITREIPAGYYGTEYNDHFRVGLRSRRAGGAVIDANSMNGLGLAAFVDGRSGATAWRDVVLPVDSSGDTIQVDIGVANVADDQYDSQVVVDFVEEVRDQIRATLTWNTEEGGIDLTYRIENGPLQATTRIDLFFARGVRSADRLGTRVTNYVAWRDDPEGEYGPYRIPGNLFANDPAGATHIIATSSPGRTGALRDARVGFGPSANQAVVWPRMLDVIKDGLRVAGQASATISSTARTPQDQARVMFNNLTNPANSLAANLARQRGLYRAPGQAVLDVFVQRTQGMTLPQILANRAEVQGAMLTEINSQGPTNVSLHTADPAVRNVVDIAIGDFTPVSGPLFVRAVVPRVTRFLDETRSNRCYHLELT